MLNISCKIVTIELENTLLNNFIADIFIFALIRFITTNIVTDEESKTVPIFPTSLEIFFIFNKIKQITEIIVTIVTIVCNFSKRFVVLFNISCIVFSYFVFKIVFLYSVQICCTNLSKAHEIPENVDNMTGTFWMCTNLEGTITINANPNSYDNCFFGTTKQIMLTGNSSILENLAQTNGNNNITVL